jgi:hypothetical protein
MVWVEGDLDLVLLRNGAGHVLEEREMVGHSTNIVVVDLDLLL